MTPTQEQTQIVKAARTGKNLRIQAYAGTGKTSTLVMVANEVLKPSLYLAFNKAMAEEAKTKFPSWVEVRTTHSLAYSHIGHYYQHKLSRPRGRYVNVGGTGSEIGKLFKIKDLELSETSKISSAAIGLCIKETVNRFEYSSSRAIGLDHIPQHLINDFKKRKGFVESTFKPTILIYAKKLWNLRKDVKSDILCTHDTYMKLFQLSKPKLSGYDVIYLDEAQDSNACLLDIFLYQKDAQKICVGDGLQAIYQWRGSVNAMDRLDFQQLCLTQSFRFGEEVGRVATEVLRDRHTGKHNHNVKGLPSIKSVVGNDSDFLLEDECYTLLCRTNAYLLSEAVAMLNKGKCINIEADMKDFVKLLNSAVALFTDKIKDIKHESIIPFTTWFEMEEEAKSNNELGRIAKIVKDGEALRYIAALEKHYNTTTPDVILTTAHKSKGREWDTVVLAEDFPSPYDKDDKFIGLEDPERNLLYMACTRAKHKLIYNNSVEECLNSAGKVVTQSNTSEDRHGKPFPLRVA